MITTDGLMQAGTFAHYALFYRSQDEYAREVCSFVREGLVAARVSPASRATGTTRSRRQAGAAGAGPGLGY